GSPVRIGGVDVGKVAGVGAGPGSTATVTLDIDDRGLPLHRDATLRIRPRLFLEGGFYVELHPGSPSAATLRSGGTIPLPQTTTPVQLHQLLAVFEAPIRTDLQGGLAELAHGLSGGGAEGLRQTAPNLAPALRDVAIVTETARGTAPHDLSRLISSSSRITAALVRDNGSLADLVTHFRVTADALAADDHALADSVSGLDALARSAPSGLRALDSALPILTRVSREAAPAVRAAPSALSETARVVEQLGTLVAPGAREQTISGLRTTFVDLPTLIVRMASLFPTVRPLAECLRSHIVPMLKSQVPDGALSSGRPVWQDFAHSLVGLAGASQNFDANGYVTRYLFGGGPEGFSTAALPGIGTLSGSTTSPLQSRPIRPAGGTPPPIRRDVDCSTQPMPTLETPAGSGQ
ncbi:MAG: phospholipid/cholesterol/gamma-HCH transport system substrate-binding protein, partial [Solirubrobacteraceae bacterium]|nr:phospholipid/cholesterol/gamma-HCH transport system substrate-binding protein [Solirubrobacteraceae bacterium]